MVKSRSLSPVFEVCANIANEVVDDSGFVAVPRLLERFHTTLRLRPLLVEGMIGSIHSQNGRLPEWTVLIDSERYPGLEPLIIQESMTRALPAQFRFAVAHELAHSLAFRSGEFGIEFEGEFEGPDAKADLVKMIEEETDRLAPLLLLSERVLANQLRKITGPLELTHVTQLLRQSGVSREVFLNRLALSRLLDRDGLWQRPHLREFGLAIGVWHQCGNASLRRSPVFLNFARLTPRGFLLMHERDRVPFEVAFGRNSPLPTETEMCLVSSAGTLACPDADQLTLEISVETVTREAGSSFLILVRNRQIRDEVLKFENIRAARSMSRVSD